MARRGAMTSFCSLHYSKPAFPADVSSFPLHISRFAVWENYFIVLVLLTLSVH